jgi:hypothetical protein
VADGPHAVARSVIRRLRHPSKVNGRRRIRKARRLGPSSSSGGGAMDALSSRCLVE